MVTRSINDANANEVEYSVERDASILSDGLSLFTISGGPIILTYAMAECYSANDPTASTIQLVSNGTIPVGSAAITAVTASIASAPIGSIIIATNLSSTSGGLTYTSASTGVGPNSFGGMYIPIGVIYTIVNIGPTTGTWKWRIKYKKLSPNSLVYPS